VIATAIGRKKSTILTWLRDWHKARRAVLVASA
jgi:hypothetical protein